MPTGAGLSLEDRFLTEASLEKAWFVLEIMIPLSRAESHSQAVTHPSPLHVGDLCSFIYPVKYFITFKTRILFSPQVNLAHSIVRSQFLVGDFYFLWYFS